METVTTLTHKLKPQMLPYMVVKHLLVLVAETAVSTESKLFTVGPFANQDLL